MREAASQRSRREDNRRKEETDYELLKVASFKRQLKALSARMHDMHLCEKGREMARRHHALLVAAVSSTSAAATAHVPPAQRIFPDPITINSKDVGNGLSELQGAFFQKTEETKKEMPVVGRGWEEEEGEVEEVEERKGRLSCRSTLFVEFLCFASFVSRFAAIGKRGL